jgi:hypothetical protein
MLEGSIIPALRPPPLQKVERACRLCADFCALLVTTSECKSLILNNCYLVTHLHEIANKAREGLRNWVVQLCAWDLFAMLRRVSKDFLCVNRPELFSCKLKEET